jgi:hypothetical protein
LPFDPHASEEDYHGIVIHLSNFFFGLLNRPRRKAAGRSLLINSQGEKTFRHAAVRWLVVVASDVAALGLPTTQGVVLIEAWYWDMNDSSRAWTKR